MGLVNILLVQHLYDNEYSRIDPLHKAAASGDVKEVRWLLGNIGGMMLTVLIG